MPWRSRRRPAQEEARLVELRATVLRVAALLGESGGGEGGAAASQAALLGLLQEPRAVRFAQRVANRVLERMAARGVQSMLRQPLAGAAAAARASGGSAAAATAAAGA